MISGFCCFSDYVYVETQPSHPYQIRRIEELTKVGLYLLILFLLSVNNSFALNEYLLLGCIDHTNWVAPIEERLFLRQRVTRLADWQCWAPTLQWMKHCYNMDTIRFLSRLTSCLRTEGVKHPKTVYDWSVSTEVPPPSV